MSILELDDVTKMYGNLVAVDEVSFDIDRGELPALIGPNGAGKTTMYNLLTGKFPPTDGTITFKGEDVGGYSTAKRTRLGMGRSFQITNVFEGLSVRQNLRASVTARSGARWNPISRIGNQRAINDETDEYIDLVGLTEIADSPAENLSYGDKRRVEIGVALATDPDLILLDEPTAGMNPTETQEMVELIKSLDDETEATFLVTEHDMDVVFSLATRILVLDQGEIIADGSPEDIRTNKRVQGAYLGEEVA
jgi:branched-chain amino acid transport system ATP-binding protein